MADIQLNKPLYESEAQDNPDLPKPRQPRPYFLARIAAVVLDALFLHVILLSVIKMLPEYTVKLGAAGPWVGFLFCFAYFVIGSSKFFLGRTLGKLITRIQVCHITGPDLNLKQAFMREGLLFGPVVFLLIIREVAIRAGLSAQYTPVITVDGFGRMLVFGWFLGNMIFAGLDTFGRAFYDRLVGTIIVNSEVDEDLVEEYLAVAQEDAGKQMDKRAVGSLAVIMAFCLAYATSEYIKASKAEDAPITEGTDVTLRQIHKALFIPNYGMPVPVPAPIGKEETTDTKTIVNAFQYLKRESINKDELKNSQETKEALNKVIDFTLSPAFQKNLTNYLNQMNLDRMKRGQETTGTLPTQMYFEVQFAEFSDLLLADHARPVYTETKIVDIPQSVLDKLTTTGATLDKETTASK